MINGQKRRVWGEKQKGWGKRKTSELIFLRKEKSESESLSAASAAKSLQLCPTLCDPIDGSPPGCAIPGILQARILEWVAMSFSNA